MDSIFLRKLKIGKKEKETGNLNLDNKNVHLTYFVLKKSLSVTIIPK